MFYTIDYDKLAVESKSEFGEDVATYVIDNNLTLGLAVVNNPDDLELNLTVEEMQGLYNNVQMSDDFFDGKLPVFKIEPEAAEATWKLLEEFQDNFPKFTVALGNKMLKRANTDAKPNTNTKVVSKPKTTVKRTKVELNRDDILVVVAGKCKQGSILHTIVTAIDQELLETVGEVSDWIIYNHIIPKTGEFADLKFAEHNIKYFLKEGKISTGIV